MKIYKSIVQALVKKQKDLTELMKSKLNYFATKLKRDYWLEAMNLDEIKK